MRKESAQGIIESIKLLFTLENGDFEAVSQCKGAKLRRADLESGLSYFGYKISVPLFSAV